MLQCHRSLSEIRDIHSQILVAGSAGVLFLPPVLMVIFLTSVQESVRTVEQKPSTLAPGCAVMLISALGLELCLSQAHEFLIQLLLKQGVNTNHKVFEPQTRQTEEALGFSYMNTGHMLDRIIYLRTVIGRPCSKRTISTIVV